MTRTFTTLFLGVAMLALSSCGSSNPKGFICPASAALVDAGSMSVLRAGTSDASGQIYKVDIVKVASDCDFDSDENRIDARIGIDFVATRPPGGDSAQYTVPYFIGVSVDGTTIVEKKLYNVQFSFAPGQSSATFSDRIEPFPITPAVDKKATDYQLLIGLQLTKEQLDYNRRVGRFPQ